MNSSSYSGISSSSSSRGQCDPDIDIKPKALLQHIKPKAICDPTDKMDVKGKKLRRTHMNIDDQRFEVHVSLYCIIKILKMMNNKFLAQNL